jgi:hypothetical protein
MRRSSKNGNSSDRKKIKKRIGREALMKSLIRMFLGLTLVAVLAGCGGPAYKGYGGDQQTGAVSVPPQWYGNDPNMEKWYTPPYFDTHYP